MSNPDTVIRKAKDRVLQGFATSPSNWEQPFFFVQAADTQLGMIDNWGDGSIGSQYPNIKWEREIELCRQTVDLLNSMRPKPAFFIICGDLVDAFPDQWPQIRTSQEKDFFNVFSGLDKDIPIVCVCGNHDVGMSTMHRHTILHFRKTINLLFAQAIVLRRKPLTASKLPGVMTTFLSGSQTACSSYSIRSSMRTAA